MISYPSPMPANFPKKDRPYAEFQGDQLKQITGVVDVLMNYPKVADAPVVRYFRPATGGK